MNKLGTSIQYKMLISLVFLIIINVSFLQGTLSENKNDTSKTIDHTISHNISELVTTTLTTKVKHQTHASSSKTSNINQTIPSTPKPVVDDVQKSVPLLQDTLSAKENATSKLRLNAHDVHKPLTRLSNTRIKNQTQSTSSISSGISQTLPSHTKPAVNGKLNEKKHSTVRSTAHPGRDIPKLTHSTWTKSSSINQTLPSTKKLVADESTITEKKNSTVKSLTQTISVPKTVTDKKTKNHTQFTFSKTSNINQHQDIVQKHPPSLQDPHSQKKNSTMKSPTQTIKAVTTSLDSKIKDQTQSTSFTSSKVNQTLSSSTKPDIHTSQKPMQGVQNKISEKTNSTNKTTVSNINIQKPKTSLLKTKLKEQTQSTSSTSQVNQTLTTSTKPKVDSIHQPVQNVQNTIGDKTNLTTKSTVNTIKVQKAATKSNTKLKVQTQSTSSTTTQVNLTLPSSTMPEVDSTQKPVQSVQNTIGGKKNSTTKSTVNTIYVQKAATKLNTKLKAQTQSTSLITTQVNLTLPSSTKPEVDSTQKPVQSVQNTIGDKKNFTTKSTVNTINVQKPVTSLLKTKLKEQAQSTPSTSQVNQTLTTSKKPEVDSIQKPVQSVQNTIGDKINSTTKSAVNTIYVQKVATKLNTKLKAQTQSTSSTTTQVNLTLPSSTMPEVDSTQKPVQSVQNTIGARKNSTTKSTVNTINVQKPVTSLLKTKLKEQTQSTPSTSQVNQTLATSTKPEVDSTQKSVQSVQNTIGDKTNSTTKSTVNTINVQKPVTKLNIKLKDQTQSTSSTTSQVNQTLTTSTKSEVDSTQKPVQSVQNTIGDKKNHTTKSTVNTINVKKPVKSLLKTKLKEQSQSTPSTSQVNQTLQTSTQSEVDSTQKPVQSVQNTISDKKNSTTKLTDNLINVQKPEGTLLKSKMKFQTLSNSSKNSIIDQTPPLSPKPAVDVVQKPVSPSPTTFGEKKNTTTKSVSHNINVNASKPENTEVQTHSASSKPTRINQTLSSTPKPAVDVKTPGSALKDTFGAKKNSTSKSTAQTIRHNVPTLTTLLNVKLKKQTHPTSSKMSHVNQTLPFTTKLVDEITHRMKKNSTVKARLQTININASKPVTTSLHTKTINQTQSTSLKISNVNQTPPSTAKPVVDEISLGKKINVTVKSASQSIVVNASKPITTPPNTKTKNQTKSSSSKNNSINQAVTYTNPAMDGIHNPDIDKLAEGSPIKIVITEGCVQRKSQGDVGNITKIRETELSLSPGSPLVMTHRINLVQGTCTGGCETDMAALRERIELLEKEMSAIKQMCVPCSGQQCPKDCSGQGKCEEGKCVCFQGFSGPDCSGKACPSNCNKKGKCVKGKCVCQTGYTGIGCSKAIDEKITVTVETVTMKMSSAMPDTKIVKTRPDKAILVKETVTKVTKKHTTAKPTGKPSPTVSTDKVLSHPTEKDKIIKTIVQQSEGMKLQEQTKGKTKVIKLGSDKQAQTDLSNKNHNAKDEPTYQNVTQRSVKKSNGTSKILDNLFKGSMNVTQSKTKITTRTAGDQGGESKTNVVSTEKDKKLFYGNVTKVQAEKKSDKHEIDASVESKTHMKHFNKTSSRLSVIGSVEVHNITSTGFIMSWEAPRDKFKNFTVTRREIKAGNEDSEKIHEAVENVTDAERPGSNRTLTKIHSSKSEGNTVKKFSQILAGTARSYHFKGLQPQTQYSISLFGSGPGMRSKIHRITLSTGPEPPTDLVFSNITETSFSLSWAKPKSIVAEFKVKYINTVTGESGSMSVDSQLSHVLLSKLAAGTTYDITVSSVLETLESEPVIASITTVPDSPTELKVVNITDTKALLVWKPSKSKVDSYILSYGTTKSPNVTITVTLSGSSVEHQLRALQRSSLYMVKMTSQVNRLQSSSVSTAFTTGSGVKLQVVTPDEVTFHSAVISWKAPRVAFKSYRLTYQLSEEVKELILNPSVTHYELTGLAAFSNYTLKIDGERDGQYISFVSSDFTTAQLPHPYPTDCSEVQINGMKESGEAEIYPEGRNGEPVRVYCDMETDGGGWTVFQRRMDGSTDFFRSWRDYSKGFGLLSGEFWLGNDVLHTLTNLAAMSLRIDLRSGNDTAFAHYANFSISSEANHYAIDLSGYSGTAGDSMKYHKGRPFSTRDKDPDKLSIHCAKAYMGGWWYKNCYKANLNGLYASYSDNKGVVWIDWKGKDASLPFAEMKLRPSNFSQTTSTTPTAQG
ncbi:mucin-2 [Danio aesculapii]|uniref:mucin-2 n=1 Tax=Danio aesculapii TaxID=1142201 RepID=UPI0024BFAFFE|nr:mucin-2 [Danio aesculapii]